MPKPSQSYLDKLFAEYEFDRNNEFHMRCWEQLVRVVTDLPPPHAVPMSLQREWYETRGAWNRLSGEPTEERLSELKAKLDEFLPMFEQRFGRKWSEVP